MKKKNRIVFKNEEVMVHQMKTFLHNLWSRTNLCIVDRSGSLILGLDGLPLFVYFGLYGGKGIGRLSSMKPPLLTE